MTALKVIKFWIQIGFIWLNRWFFLYIAYLYGIIAIVGIWAISAINVFILSRVQKRHEKIQPNDNMFLISALNALAIGILLGDAFLHIIPSVNKIYLIA